MATRKPKATATTDADNYKAIPALAAYIDRIGAEQLNFRRFMVKEHKGNYYTEKSLIIINADFSIRCTNKEHAPTDEEEEAIAQALATVQWPKAIGARNTDKLLETIRAKPEDLFEFYDRRTGLITMVQQKRIKDDGSKQYMPWTFFSDGIWRAMEPDGALPFWKPLKRTKAKIMVHEGAKAARHMDWLVNSKDKAAQAARKAHPWCSELVDWEHWGIIGGALAPHRAAYAEVKDEKPIDLCYVCDNDWPGKQALAVVSRHCGMSLKGVFFDKRWPLGWDMADPLAPGKGMGQLFTKAGRYIGPSLHSLMFSATWATELVPNPDGGKPVIAVRRNFLEEWYHCVRPEVFVHATKPSMEYTLNEFNNVIAPFSHSKETGALVKKDAVHKNATLCYDPGRQPGAVLDQDGNTQINMHLPTHVVEEIGDVGPWLEFMENLFPDDGDRALVCKWVATLIAHPEIKMHYSMLLISDTQGVGKTTLGQDILGPIVGHSNTSAPSEADIVDNPFNSWCAHKRLVLVNEIYAGHSSKAYDKLKSFVTDKTIEINRKYQAAYRIENWVHIIACSNSFRALKLSDDDRRWLVPKVTEKLKPTAYWRALHAWLEEENGLGKIIHWAREYCAKHGHVLKGEHAPWTTVKQQVIEETMSPGMLLVSSILDRIKAQANGELVFVTDGQLVQLIKDRIYEGRASEKLEKPLTIRKLARGKGWHIGEHATQMKSWGATTGPARLLFSSLPTIDTNPTQMAIAGKKPFDINSLEDM